MLDLCGRKINPLLLKIRSTGAEVAGTQNTLNANRERAGNSLHFCSQKSKTFSGFSISFVYSKYLESCCLAEDVLDVLAVFLLLYFEKKPSSLEEAGLLIESLVSSAENVFVSSGFGEVLRYLFVTRSASLCSLGDLELSMGRLVQARTRPESESNLKL